MKNYFTLLVLLIIASVGCNKDVQKNEQIKLKDDFQSRAFQWTISNSLPSIKNQLSISRSKIAYINNQPTTIF